MLRDKIPIILLLVLISGTAGCGGGGGGGGTSPPPEPPPPPPADPVLRVSPTSISQTVLLGGEAGSATVTLTNDDNEGNAYTVTTNADWISVSSSSGTVPANGTTNITLTFTCNQETELNGSVTVTGSNGSNDVSTLSVALSCDAPPLVINVTTAPAPSHVLTGGEASATLAWDFSSPWSGQGSVEYAITSDNSGISISNASGTAEPESRVQHDLGFTCESHGRHTPTLTISVGDDDRTDQTWEIACQIEEQEFVLIRMYQGVLAVEIRANTDQDGEVSYEVDERAKLLEGRVTYVSVVENHVGLVPLGVEIAVLTDPETVLDDEIETIATAPSEDESVWTTEHVYNMPVEYVDRDTAFEIRLDPNDAFPEENEDNNNHRIDYVNPEISIASTDYRNLEIVVLPIIGVHPAPTDIESHLIYDMMHDLMPVPDYTITIGETIDMSEEEWDIEEALTEVRQRRIEDQASTSHYHGLFVYETGVSGSCGLAYVPGWEGVSALPSQFCRANTFAHEIGHNLSLSHAPGCEAPNPDTSFPYDDGGIGDEFGWLINSRESVSSETVTHFDVMGYCEQTYVAQYHYARALRFWEQRSISISSTPVASHPIRDPATFRNEESLILIGRITENGVWSLERIKFIERELASIAPEDSRFTVKIVDSMIGDTLFSEPLQVHVIDHLPDLHWSAVVPAPSFAHPSVIVTDENGNILFAEDLNRGQ